MKKRMRMQLFGEFFLGYEGKTLDEKMLHSNKLVRLLVYILFYRDRMISTQELINVFLEDDSRNPAGTLKNQMYRLRNMLKVLGPEEFIQSLRGSYNWNSEIEVETDYETFSDLASRSMAEDDVQQREQLCCRALEIYRSEVPSQLEDESWILPKVVYHQSLYMDVVKELCTIYEDQKKWTDLEVLCNKALNTDLMEEEINCWLIKSLYKQKKYDLALAHYGNISRLLYEKLGLRDTERLHETYKEMMAENGGSLTNIASLLHEVGEKERPTGAFMCDYQIFRQIYRLEARRIGRLGVAEYVMLTTVRETGMSRGGIFNKLCLERMYADHGKGFEGRPARRRRCGKVQPYTVHSAAAYVLV